MHFYSQSYLLYRSNFRTDFYHVTNDKSSPIGLPPGWAENYVKHAFFKWKPKEKPPEISDSQLKASKDVVSEEIVIDETTPETKAFTSENLLDTGVQKPSNEFQMDTDEKTKKETVQNASDFTTSEYYNGAAYDNYCWSQSIKEIDVSVKVPENVRTKDLSVSILSKKVSIALKTDKSIILEGELCQKCKQFDAIWSLDKSKLQIHLEKAVEMWWDCLFLSEPKLDVSKIDCSRPLEELPEEAQAKIEELTWNQERKRQGLPTSDELIMQDKLKKAWSAEGSPFKGPFDPSTVTFS